MRSTIAKRAAPEPAAGADSAAMAAPGWMPAARVQDKDMPPTTAAYVFRINKTPNVRLEFEIGNLNQLTGGGAVYREPCAAGNFLFKPPR